jgi:uncharacterized OsmC-like protein
MSGNIVKRWSVSAISLGRAPLSLFCDGRPLTQTAPATIDNVSPVEYLLVSAATCFALSVRAVLQARKLSGIDFEVAATGEKAPDLPSRLNHIALAAVFRYGVDESQAAAIAADAKSMCTVTNTILRTPDITVGAQVAGAQVAGAKALGAENAAAS